MATNQTNAQEIPTLVTDQARLDALAEKANEGTLSGDEAKEYDTYVELMDFVALLRLKARARVSDSPRS